MSAPVNSSSAKENFGCAFSSSESPSSFFTLMNWEEDRVRHIVFSTCFLCLWQSQSILSHHTVEHFPLWLVCGSMISSYRLNCVAASLSPFGSLPGSCFSTSTGALALHAFLFRLAITVAVPIGEGTQKQWGEHLFHSSPHSLLSISFLSPLSNFLTEFLWHLFEPKDPLQFPNCSLKSTQILQKSGPLLYH